MNNNFYYSIVGVMPDKEIQELLIRIFGRQATPTVRLLRMMYWLPKLKYASPWPPPEPRPKNAVEVAKLGVKRMCSMDLETEINLFNVSFIKFLFNNV